jgi:hypothetical protein
LNTLTGRFLGRPIHFLLIILVILCGTNLWFYVIANQRLSALEETGKLFDIATSGLGLTDLCVATEARYTRHPSVSDPIAPFMDHPGAIEHFPTGSFWAPPSLKSR